MTEYARRIHRTVVELQPGETRQYRLPPMSPGPIVIEATVPSVIAPLAREHRTGITAGPLRAPAETAAVQPAHPAAGTGPTAAATAQPAAPARWRPPLGGWLDPGLGGSVFDPGHHPDPPRPPTDLTMELLHGSARIATSGAHILATSPSKDDAWSLRLTRKPGGSAVAKYIIEANYPSGLPIIERRIAPAAFQRAFDSNWNQHQYVSFEMSPHYHLYIHVDHAFADLYGLEHEYDIDLGVPAIVPNMPRATTKDIRFTIGQGPHPLSGIVVPHHVPFVDLHVTFAIEGRGDSWIDIKFYLTNWSIYAGYISRVSSPVINAFVIVANEIPTVHLTVKDVTDRIESKLDALQGSKFGPRVTPWLVGEPERELWGLMFDTVHSQIVVKSVGRPVPPSTAPVVLDPSRPPPPPPDTHPRLFDTPDEVPVAIPGDEAGPGVPLPRTPYITSPGKLAPIEHIIVVMQENRSFDQILGYLSREAGRSDVNGLLPDPNTRDFNVHHAATDTPYRPQRATGTDWFGDYTVPGPCHEHECIVNQISDGMKGFVNDFAARLIAHYGSAAPRYLQRVMDYYGPDQLPAYAALAQNFAICDAWFCSHVGPTWPNRFITFTGDLNRSRENTPELNQPDFDRLAPLTRKTIFDHLTERGISWRLYEHGYSFLRLYGRYTFDLDRIQSFTDPNRGFAADARAGRLPQVTFIEPDYIDLPPGNDDHPPGDLVNGQRFIATIASALLDSPQWDHSLLIVTYDEAGGFYDHQIPPMAPPLSGVGELSQLGPRVPAFVMSPYVAPGSVSKTTYDHTSILATIVRRFCSPKPPRMSPRADAAHDLRDMLLDRPRPRAEFNAVHDQLVAIRNTPGPTPQKPKKLAKWKGNEDFHSLLAYVSSFT